MTSVAEHIAAFSADERDAVRRIYDLGRRLAPQSEEGVSDGLPCLTVGGKAFCAVQRAARHLSLVPFSGKAITAAADALAAVTTTAGTVRFTATQPLPDAAVEAVLRARLAEIAASS